MYLYSWATKGKIIFVEMIVVQRKFWLNKGARPIKDRHDFKGRSSLSSEILALC